MKVINKYIKNIPKILIIFLAFQIIFCIIINSQVFADTTRWKSVRVFFKKYLNKAMDLLKWGKMELVMLEMIWKAFGDL